MEIKQLIIKSRGEFKGYLKKYKVLYFGRGEMCMDEYCAYQPEEHPEYPFRYIHGDINQRMDGAWGADKMCCIVSRRIEW